MSRLIPYLPNPGLYYVVLTYPKTEIGEEKIEAFKGAVSLPFARGDNVKIAVKIIDDRGIESLKVISL